MSQFSDHAGGGDSCCPVSRNSLAQPRLEAYLLQLRGVAVPHAINSEISVTKAMSVHRRTTCSTDGYWMSISIGTLARAG
jgi:hypothetical protein